MISNLAYSQQELPVERKYKQLQLTENQLFKLPYDFEIIKNEFYPEVLTSRENLAPNYPDISQLPRTQEARDNAFINWINEFPGEYQAYFDFLSQYITSKKEQP